MDVEDASRMLRLARAERDAAQERLDELNEKHWALLSEYEASQSFEGGNKIRDTEREYIDHGDRRKEGLV